MDSAVLHFANVKELVLTMNEFVEKRVYDKCQTLLFIINKNIFGIILFQNSTLPHGGGTIVQYGNRWYRSMVTSGTVVW